MKNLLNPISKKVLLLSLGLTLFTITFGQQWSGNNNTTGDITRTGKVGIGVSFPWGTLDVNGDITLSSATPNIMPRPKYTGYTGTNMKIIGGHLESEDGDLDATGGNLILEGGEGDNEEDQSRSIGGNVYLRGGNGYVRGNIFLGDNGGKIFMGSGTFSNRYLFEINGSSYFKGSIRCSTLAGTGTRFIVTDPSGNISPSSLLYVSSTGQLGINTNYVPSAYKLGVQGKIICEELQVQLRINWPDFVFNKDYSLMPLNEVEEFINENNHLPGIPSAEEVTNSGINVGEMNALLLQKIEELTLYVIEIKKENEELKKEMKELKENK